VAEWCWDPVFSNGFRVIAGGGWNDDAFSCEIANTTIGEPYIRFPAIGFRVARSTSLVRVEGGNLPQVSGLGEISVDTFYLGRNEVTWGLWQKVRDWAAANGYDIGHVGSGCDLDHPVTSISWHNAVKWCNARSEMEGLEPVYTVSGAVYRDGQSIPDQDLTASGYRLPTEAEWEFAARGGNLTNGYVYSGSNDIESVGWYLGNTFGISCDMYDGHGTSPVGEKAPNELGINDMSGNVWEWCWNASEVDPDARMFRGGSFRYGESLCTMTYRYYYPPHSTGLSFGFRIARNSAQ
jgi:formylglycine-generating enzyme required for sulfatase activity